MGMCTRPPNKLLFQREPPSTAPAQGNINIKDKVRVSVNKGAACPKSGMDRRHHPAGFLFSTGSRARTCRALAQNPAQPHSTRTALGWEPQHTQAGAIPLRTKPGGTQGLPKAQHLWPSLLSRADGAAVISRYSGDPQWDTGPWQLQRQHSTSCFPDSVPCPRLGEQHLVQHLWKGFQSQRYKGVITHIVSLKVWILSHPFRHNHPSNAGRADPKPFPDPSSPACIGGKTTLGTAGFDTALAKDGKTSSYFRCKDQQSFPEEHNAFPYGSVPQSQFHLTQSNLDPCLSQVLQKKKNFPFRLQILICKTEQ